MSARAAALGRSVSADGPAVSGLPWSLFDDHTQRSIMSQVAEVIAPDGAFTTFAYSHGLLLSAARRFRHLLHETFEEVVVSATVLRNVPPAFTYICRRPRRTV